MLEGTRDRRCKRRDSLQLNFWRGEELTLVEGPSKKVLFYLLPRSVDNEHMGFNLVTNVTETTKVQAHRLDAL